jgi:hypothetical protein
MHAFLDCSILKDPCLDSQIPSSNNNSPLASRALDLTIRKGLQRLPQRRLLNLMACMHHRCRQVVSYSNRWRKHKPNKGLLHFHSPTR